MNALTVIDAPEGRPVLALELPKDTTFDEWVEIGRKLCLTNKALQWHIGDWWAFGDHRYGERAKAAAEGLFGREFQTIANTASICRAFKGSRRREVLSFSHHAEVAALEPKQADALLERAERDGWSTRDIRAQATEIKRAAQITPRPAPDPLELEWSALVGAWNRAGETTQRRFIEALESIDHEPGLIDPFEC